MTSFIPNQEQAMDLSRKTCGWQLGLSFAKAQGSLRPAKCRVGPSTIHGQGLFATRPIAKDERITYYPSHGFKIAFGGEEVALMGAQDIPIEAVVTRSADALRTCRAYRKPTKAECKHYSLRVTPQVEIIGYPEFTSEHYLLGHMANDAMKVSSTTHDAVEELQYTAQALLTNNAVIDTEKMGIMDLAFLVATRPIAVGEEITVPYGYAFWVSKNQ
jgi:hypothetical protein